MWITIKPFLHIPIIKTTTTTTLTITTPPLIKFPTTVTTTLHRKQTTNSIQTQKSGEEIGGLGHAVFSAIKSNTIEIPSTTITTTNQNQNGKPEKRKEKLGIEQEERTISGSDVLWALQKAITVKKKKKKKIVQRKKMAKNGDDDYNSSGGSDEDEEDYFSSVKPFKIKNEWIHKLDDLDLRLKQLSEI